MAHPCRNRGCVTCRSAQVTLGDERHAVTRNELKRCAPSQTLLPSAVEVRHAWSAPHP